MCPTSRGLQRRQDRKHRALSHGGLVAEANASVLDVRDTGSLAMGLPTGNDGVYSLLDS